MLHVNDMLFWSFISLLVTVRYSPLCWKSGCLRVPWIQCRGDDAMEGRATGEGGVCFVPIGLEACLWSGEGPEDFRWVWLFSDHASCCLIGMSAAASTPAAMETADPHLWAQNTHYQYTTPSTSEPSNNQSHHEAMSLDYCTAVNIYVFTAKLMLRINVLHLNIPINTECDMLAVVSLSC